MKDCVLAKDYAYIYHLSKIESSLLLVELSYPMLHEASLLFQLTVVLEELLVPVISSQGVEDLKAQYAIIKENVSRFESDFTTLGCLVIWVKCPIS